jgi:hypothetical protein
VGPSRRTLNSTPPILCIYSLLWKRTSRSFSKALLMMRSNSAGSSGFRRTAEVGVAGRTSFAKSLFGKIGAAAGSSSTRDPRSGIRECGPQSPHGAAVERKWLSGFSIRRGRNPCRIIGRNPVRSRQVSLRTGRRVCSLYRRNYGDRQPSG